MADIGWARSRRGRAEKEGLRRGAWYRIVEESGKSWMVLDVHQVKVLGPRLAGRSVLAVRPTGAGKSLCYQLPALMARGLTLVVSPLISLMQDQVAALRRRGIPAAYLNSLLSADERRAILDAALSGSLALLYCAPERLGSLVRQLARAGREVPLLAVDQAHCIAA